MYILGLDTGLTKRNPTGWAVYDDTTNMVSATGLLAFSSELDWSERVQRIAQAVEDEARRSNVVGMAIETPWVGKDPQAALKLGALVGAFIHAAGRLHIPDYLMSPAEGAQALGIEGKGEQKKAAAIKMVQLRFGLNVSAHQADAIAVALAAVPKLRIAIRVKLAG